MKQIKKRLLETPKITNKEISDHIAKYMSHADVNWLAMGTQYQADASICPFCGQAITSGEYRKMTAQLSRFIKSRQKQKADDIAGRVRRLQPFFDEMKLAEIFRALQAIKSENQEDQLLRQKSIRLLESLQLDPSIGNEEFSSIADKLAKKILNPYEAVSLSSAELTACEAVLLMHKKLSKLESALNSEIQAIELKIQKTSEYTKSKSLYEASFGEAHESITELIALAKSIEEVAVSIKKCQQDIDDLFEAKKLDAINDFLRELNVNFRVKLDNRKYCVQIAGYEATEYNKENKILCSEGERRMLALAYFLQEISSLPEPKVIVIDDPISSLDLSRKSVVAFKIAELMGNSENQIIVLSHDISFVEKICSVVPKNLDLGLLELCREKSTPFKELHLDDYLITDEEVYSRIIQVGEESPDKNIKLIGLMALRPYAYIKSGMNPMNPDYLDIEKRSTHLAHSVYSRSARVPYTPGKYNRRSLRAYCKKVSKVAKVKVNHEKLVPDDWTFTGFDYEKAWEVYSAIPGDSICNLRMKAILLRLVLETSLYMLVSKKTFNPERIGLEYSKATKGTTGEKHDMCVELDRLYDLSKKYHHGADDGSTLGLSALNPDEMLYFDEQIGAIHNWIVNHPNMCNPNAVSDVS